MDVLRSRMWTLPPPKGEGWVGGRLQGRAARRAANRCAALDGLNSPKFWRRAALPSQACEGMLALAPDQLPAILIKA